MQVDEADSTLSSSPISSAPVSPHADAIGLASRPQSALHDPQQPGGLSISSPATSAQPHTSALNSTSSLASADKPKRQRRKKELGPDGKPIDDGKPKVTKPRKAREPKVPAVNGSAAASANGPAKKKIKSETDSTPRQSTITEMVNNYSPAIVPQRQAETLAPSSLPVPPPLTMSPTPRPATSGQRYDPIRGMTVDTYARSASAAPLVQVNRASASPAIASLIDPPSSHNSSLVKASQPAPTQQSTASSTQHLLNIDQQESSTSSPVVVKVQPAVDSIETMEVDEKSPSAKLVAKDKLAADAKAQSKASSTTQTPKANAGRASPPAHKGTGSGLLSTSDLFGGGTTMDGGERKMINIDIHIKLDPNGGNHINVAQEIIKKYGRDAINPRAAAHRERLMQVMAAANKIEGNSADDMSIDLMSDIGDDSNIEMGGMDDGSAAADGDKPRKRRKKVEEYDLDDEFIDDTELAWQQQAAVAKDGFFVYSGPLIPEGEAARVETAAAARGRGGRGRGRGKAGTSSTTHASLAEKKETVTPAPSTRGRGGRAKAATAAPRKRVTKAEKEKLEAEKAAKVAPSTAPVPPPLAAPPTQVPLVATAAATTS